MDMISIGGAAAALLGAKFAGEFAGSAGKNAWELVGKLRRCLAERFSGDAHATEALKHLESEPHNDQYRAAVSQRIANAAGEDRTFAESVSELVEAARRDPAGVKILAVARDNAKQVNFGGDNFGQIRL